MLFFEKFPVKRPVPFDFPPEKDGLVIVYCNVLSHVTWELRGVSCFLLCTKAVKPNYKTTSKPYMSIYIGAVKPRTCQAVYLGHCAVNIQVDLSIRTNGKSSRTNNYMVACTLLMIYI